MVILMNIIYIIVKIKKKTGRYSVLNVYNEDSSPFGMSEEEFAPYRKKLT